MGKRISIKHTRALLNAALTGKLADVEPIIKIRSLVSKCPNPVRMYQRSVLYPAEAWPRKDDYDDKYRQLAARFNDNFQEICTGVPTRGEGSRAKGRRTEFACGRTLN